MGSVNRLRRSVASTLVIARLVRLGYLRPAKRHKPNVILQAVERLKSDLWHVGIIEDGDLTKIDKAARRSTKQEKQTRRQASPQHAPQATSRLPAI